MQKREIHNHNDNYVVFFEFEDEHETLEGVDEPLDKSGQSSTESSR